MTIFKPIVVIVLLVDRESVQSVTTDDWGKRKRWLTNELLLSLVCNSPE